MTDSPTAPDGAKRVSARVAWAARLGGALFRLFGMTWRIRHHNADAWRTLRAHKAPYIFAFWHHDMLAMLWGHRNEDVAVLVSEHGDGEIIARIIEGVGNQTVRGSTTRGGTRALIGMIRALERGSSAAITPDGPRGPRHVWQPGVFSAARRASAPIVGIGIAVNRAWRFNSWDKFVLPKPFARIDIMYGDPVRIDAASSDFSADVQRFTDLMARLADRAQQAAARG